ncbi:unnamed protein product, partial [marine sediment metagenome]
MRLQDCGYEEWKKYVIVDYCNLTEEEFYQHSKNDPEVNHILNVIIRLLWGTYNGTLSEAERMNLQSQLTNSVHITNCTIIQSNDAKFIIDLTYYVFNFGIPPTWDEAETLEVRLNYDDDTPFSNVDPSDKLYYQWYGSTKYVHIGGVDGYPMESGVQVFHKYLDRGDYPNTDMTPTFYNEHIEFSSSNIELERLRLDVIIMSSFQVMGFYPQLYADYKYFLIDVGDDDPDPPEFKSFQARFDWDPFNDPNQMLTIFSKPNGNPLDSVDKDILIRVNYEDYSGIWLKDLQFRFIRKDGHELVKATPIWDFITDLFWIPRDLGGLGWRYYYDLGDLDKIQIRSKASDYDNDRNNDTLASGWTGWIDVAQVVRNELALEGNKANIQFEYSNDILKPYEEYHPYPGEE